MTATQGQQQQQLQQQKSVIFQGIQLLWENKLEMTQGIMTFETYQNEWHSVTKDYIFF